MDKIKVIEDIISIEDCNLAISYYDDLVAQGHFKKVGDGRLLVLHANKGFPFDLVNKYLPKINESYKTTFYIRDILLSIYSDGAHIPPHWDEHQRFKDNLGAVIYFNDDFEGGEIYFSNYDFYYKPKKGSIILFPCNDSEYEHGVRPVTSGTRYTMPIEFTLKKEEEFLIKW